jgi:hydrogenase nickel incorporation protein HypA/HybF
MHEWALAEAVIESVKNHLKDRKEATLISVTILFGELQKIDRDIFQDGMKALLKREAFDEGVFTYEVERASFLCQDCRAEWGCDDIAGIGEEEREAIHFIPEVAHAYMRCPRCGSPDFKVDKGRGVSIKSIVLEESAREGDSE